MQNFRNLDVWKKAHDLAIDVHNTLQRTRRIEAPLKSQASRAAQSIPANIAEGCGMDTQAELARFADIALGSATELEYHLLLARDLGQLGNEDFERLTASTIEVKKMLFGLRRAIRTGRKKPKAPVDLAVASAPA